MLISSSGKFSSSTVDHSLSGHPDIDIDNEYKSSTSSTFFVVNVHLNGHYEGSATGETVGQN